MKHLKIILLLITAAVCRTSYAQAELYQYCDDPDFIGSCTSVMVGKKASSDGSVMTAHSCDSYYRTYVTIEPRKTFKDGELEPYYFNVLRKEEP